MDVRPEVLEFSRVGLFTFCVAVLVLALKLLHSCILHLLGVFGSTFAHIRPKWRGKALFVIAHPDDECMFFGPSLHYACEQIGPSNVHILCLTNGNYYGGGKIREKELFDSCCLFGLKKNNVKIVDDPYLQDGGQTWDKRRVIGEILKYVNGYNIETLITFDNEGISGHPNHRAIYNAICGSEQIMKVKGRNLVCYFLETVNIFRKYISVFDIFYSVIHCYIANFMKNDRKLVVARSVDDIGTTGNAMKKHKSQFVWFRKLYIRFSRYLIMNTLKCKDNLFHKE